MAEVSLKSLLEAGSHFGHQTKRWNPKMKPYIFGSRNGIYIIDLLKTLEKISEADEFLQELGAGPGKVLFVGTKRQAQTAIEEEAQRCEMPYVTKRWLGGTLTNFTTIKLRVNRLKELQQMDNGEGPGAQLTQGKTKKEVLQLSRERTRLEKYFQGIRDMDKIPRALFVVDPNKESIAIREARKMGVHIIAVVDTNCNPDGVDTILPGNDDAIRAIRLFSSVVADAIIKGKARKKDEEELAEAFKAEQESRDKADKAKAAAETKAAAPATAAPEKTTAPAPAEAVKPDPAPANPTPPAEPPKA